MEVQAITSNVRMSAQKMREVVRQIQGLPAAHAQAVLAVVPRKGARVVAKTLKSAMANAEDLKAAQVRASQDLKTESCGSNWRWPARPAASSGSPPRRAVRPGRSSSATATLK